MASSYSQQLRIQLMQTGEKSGQWGDITNANWDLIQSAVAGSVNLTLSAGNNVLTYADGSPDQSRCAILNITSAAGVFNIFAPPVTKTYIIKNNTGVAGTIYCSSVIGNTTAAGAGFSIRANSTCFVHSNGTDFIDGVNHIAGPLTLDVALGSSYGGTGYGTGASPYAVGDILYASASNTLSKLPIGTNGQFLTVTAGIPAWASSAGTVASVTGTPPVVSSGGLNPAISLAAAYGDTLNPYGSKTANFVLSSPDGSAGVPSFRALVAADLPTVTVAKGGTNITSYSTGDILYASSSSTLTRLGIGSSGQVLTVSGGLPVWGAGSSGGGVSQVNSGNGMNFSAITTTGTVTLGTPSPITSSSTDSVTSTSHTHSITGAAFLAGTQTFTGKKTFTGGIISTAFNFTDPNESIYASSSVINLSVANTSRIRLSFSDFQPTNDDQIWLGYSANRWKAVYAVNGTIQTSDQNEKQDIANLDEAERRVAVRIKGLIKKFRFKDAVVAKGDSARIHVGVIAQEVRDAFTAEGLDATRYGIFCSDTWWEKEEQESYPPTGESRLVNKVYREAVNGAIQKTRLGVRYDELLAFVIAAM